jgi:pre-mRNA-splicing factor CWC22
MGITKLNEKLTDPDLKEYFTGIFPKDHPQNSRFSINFFYSIGLNPITQDLRQFLFEEVEKHKTDLLAIEQNDQLDSPGNIKSESEKSSEESDSEEIEKKPKVEEKIEFEEKVSKEIDVESPKEKMEMKEEEGLKVSGESQKVGVVEEGLGLGESSNKDLLRKRSKDKKKKDKKKRKKKDKESKKSKVKKRISKKKRKKSKNKSKRRRAVDDSMEMSVHQSASSLSDF